MINDIIKLGRGIYRSGLSNGNTGNVSMRLGSTLILSPSGVCLHDLKLDSLSIVDFETREHISGPPPTKEISLHYAIYEKNPSHLFVAHAHSRNAVAASLLPPWEPKSAIPPLTPYFVMTVGQTPLAQYAAPGTESLASAVKDVEYPFFGALLANHGSICSAISADEALTRLLEIETTAELYLRVVGHDHTCLTEHEVRVLADKYGTPWS